MDEQEILDRMLAILDPNIARPANQVARMVWLDRKFNSQQAAGVTALKYLAKLAHQGLAQTTRNGWRKISR